MSLFKMKNPTMVPAPQMADTSALAEMALNGISDGVLLVDVNGVVKFANPAAAELTGYGAPINVVGLNYQTILRLATEAAGEVTPGQSQLDKAMQANQAMTSREYLLLSAAAERRAAIFLSLTPTGGSNADRIITFRDITKELEEEEKQNDFISTASHEMRTPVASIEGYLGLALNPQTATIDERAQKYLEAAHAASQHLGHLFKDLLDVTKLDDGRLQPHLVPVEIVPVVQEMAGAHAAEMQQKKLDYSFGTNGPITDENRLEPAVYAAVDMDFLREILDNLLENAIKYTQEGGKVWVNARGDGDNVLINVTDTGIGVSPDDAAHIFQKFYRVDNSDTRKIGGTGLGLYLVKQRVEALGGRVWVESAFGDGSTFFVSLPRLTPEEYEKRKIALQNEAMVPQSPAQPVAQPATVPVAQPTAQPVAAPVAQPPAPQPIQPATTPQITTNNQGV